MEDPKKHQHVRIEGCWFKHYIDFMRFHVHFHVWSFLVSHTLVRTLLVWRTRKSNNISLDITFSHIFTHSLFIFWNLMYCPSCRTNSLHCCWKGLLRPSQMTTRSRPFSWVCKWQIVINDTEGKKLSSKSTKYFPQIHFVEIENIIHV